ncbi:MAG: hypothetical protein ACWA41_02780 [Putridiphycobacter sp.]
MRKILLAVCLAGGLNTATAQVGFYVNGTKKNECSVHDKNVKVSMPVPKELNDYKHASITVTFSDPTGKSDINFQYHAYLSLDARSTGTASAFLVKPNGGSDFIGILYTYEGNYMFSSPYNELNLLKSNSNQSRTYQKLKMTVSINKGVPTQRYDSQQNVTFTEFPYQSVKKYSESLIINFDEPSKELISNEIKMSFPKTIANAETEVWDYKEDDFEYQGKAIQFKSGRYDVKYNSDVPNVTQFLNLISVSNQDFSVEDLKKDLVNYFHSRANKDQTNTVTLNDAFGMMSSKFGKSKGNNITSNTEEKVSYEAPLIKWHKVFNTKIDFLFPGYYDNEPKDELKKNLKLKAPNKPNWEERVVGQKKAFVIEGEGFAQYNRSLSSETPVDFLSMFIVEHQNRIIIGFYQAYKYDSRKEFSVERSQALLKEIYGSLKFL